MPNHTIIAPVSVEPVVQTPAPPTPPPQRLLGPEETLYFLHIPKCAGTTFRAFLEDHFEGTRICPHVGVLEEVIARPPSELAQYRLIAGHHGWFLHRLLEAPPVVITVLRDPVARAISHFYHQRNRHETWLHDIIRDWTFEQYVHDPLGISELTNFQTRYLALDRIQEDYWEHSPIRDRDNEALVAKYSDPRLLERAIARLEGMPAFGFVERLEDTMRLVAHTFGWPARSSSLRLNPRRSERDSQDLTDRALEQVRRLTVLDQRLYDHARALFERRIAGLTPEAAEGAYSAAMASRPRISTVRYGFDQPLFGEGWYPRSRRSEGPVNRWTGPTTTPCLDFPLAADRDLKIAFHAGARLPEQLNALRVTVNGEPLVLTRWQTRFEGENDSVFSGVISRDTLLRGSGYSRIRFETNRTVRPCDIEDSPDRRDLAIHFRWIEIA